MPAPWQKWTRCLRPTPTARARVIAFPPAGGGASFFAWTAHSLPSELEPWAVQYPGREDRLDEPPSDNLATMARRCAEALQWLQTTPFILFGHSIGALVAYETAHCLARMTPTPVLHLFASGSHPPGAVRPASRSARADLEHQMARLAPSEYRDILMGTLQADLQALADYRSPHAGALTCPLTALGGDSDPEISHQELAAWKSVTTGPFTTVSLAGDHHYVRHQTGRLSALLAAA